MADLLLFQTPTVDRRPDPASAREPAPDQAERERALNIER